MISVRRRVPALALPLLCLLLAATGCSDDATGDPSSPRSSTSRPGAAADPDAITSADFAAIGRLLDRRAEALVDGDRRRFLATLDPANARLERRQLVVFDNLQGLPIDKLFYGVGSSGLPPGEVADRRNGDDSDPVLRPQVYEHVELSLVMDRPVSNEVSMTFVERDGRWLLGSDLDGTDVQAFQSRPWYGGPIAGARDERLLVLTDEGADVSAQELLDKTSAALDDVADVLDLPGDQPILVDATSNGEPVQVNQSSEEAGAVTQSLYATTRDGEDVTGLAGTLVKANPGNVQQLVEDDQTLRHELTHVVLDGYGNTNPLWSTEGIAEYVGAYPQLLADSFTDSASLLRDISRREVELTEAGDWGSDPELDYLSARAFTEYLVTRSGVARYLEMMATFRRLANRNRVILGQGLYDTVLERVYGLSAEEVAEGGFDLLEGLAPG